MLWYDKSMGPFKTCITQEKETGRLTKKVTKSDLGEGFAAKKCDATHSKKQDFASDVLFEWPVWWCFICCILMNVFVYLLMVLLAFYETNKPNISK